jgi:hypothetical protein
MPVTTIAETLLCPFRDAKLGRLFKGIDGHLVDYHDPTSCKAQMMTIKYDECDQQSSVNSFGFSLAPLFSAACSNRSGTQVSIDPKYFKAHALDDFDRWFDVAINKKDTREWVEGVAIRGAKIYVTIGFCTGRAAYLADSSTQGGSASSARSETQIFAPSEQVFAVQYREIKYNWLDSRKVKEPTPENPRLWLGKEECGFRRCPRGGDDDDDDVNEDTIQVEISDIAYIINRSNATESEALPIVSGPGLGS